MDLGYSQYSLQTASNFLNTTMQAGENRVKAVLKETSEAILPFLRAVHAAADVFPPLKTAVGMGLVIGETIATFKSNKKEWTRFGTYVQEALGCIVQSLPGANTPRADLRQNLEKLEQCVPLLTAVCIISDDFQWQYSESNLSRYRSTKDEKDC